MSNLGYLSQFPVDDILYWFRQRAGYPNPPNASSWGWDGHTEPMESAGHTHPHVVAAKPPPGRNVDGPFGLRGSVAGAFLMGSGGVTRWTEDAGLRSRLEQASNAHLDLGRAKGSVWCVCPYVH